MKIENLVGARLNAHREQTNGTCKGWQLRKGRELGIRGHKT